jgi:hypothetical protein
LRFSTRTLRRSFSSASVIAGAAALALGLAAPAGAQSIPGPLKVTDSGPSYPTGAGYAIKGITGFANDSGVFGYGTVASSAINIDGVVGYVQTQQSVGVVGWSASTGTQAYGVYGFSATGPGVYGFNNNGGAPSIYGLNSSAGGTAMYGLGDNGVVGITAATSAVGGDAGVAGTDSSTAGANFGVAGVTVNAVGSALYGNALNGGAGADVNSDSGFGLIADSSFGIGAEVLSGQTGGLALVGLPSGEGLVSFGRGHRLDRDVRFQRRRNSQRNVHRSSGNGRRERKRAVELKRRSSKWRPLRRRKRLRRLQCGRNIPRDSVGLQRGSWAGRQSRIQRRRG